MPVDYIGALKGFLEIMDGPDADLYFDDIASLTGERYIGEMSFLKMGETRFLARIICTFHGRNPQTESTYTKVARINDDGTETIHTAHKVEAGINFFA
jgi:hypothetical protein